MEVISGKTFDEFLRTRIFEPLGMQDTYFFVPDNKANRLATAYTWYPDKGLQRFPDTPIVEGSFSYSADYPYQRPQEALLRRRGALFHRRRITRASAN